MIDSARDQPTIVEVLVAFVREHAGGWPPGPEEDPEPDLAPVAADVPAAVTVLARRPRDREEHRPVNLSGVILAAADLTGVHLVGANLNDAKLWKADLTGAHLQEVRLTDEQLSIEREHQAAVDADEAGPGSSGIVV